jgi:erythromycin esterase-like protein
VPNNVGKIPPNDWRRQHYLDWLCTAIEDRDPRTMKALAEQYGLSIQTLHRWKEDAGFLADWEHQYRRTVGSPEKAQRVIDKLYETAEDRTDPRQVQAAKAYLEAIDAVKPRQVEISVKRGDAKNLTDDDLYALLAERAEAELAARTDG